MEVHARGNICMNNYTDLVNEECNEHSFSLGPVPKDDLFQFRVIQREHAGWFSLSAGCDGAGSLLWCSSVAPTSAGYVPANIPRFVESRPLNLSSTPIAEISECPQRNTTANVPPLCTSTQSPYL